MDTHVTLVGGGIRGRAPLPDLLSPFLAAAPGDVPQIAVVIIDEGQDLRSDAGQYHAFLRGAGTCTSFTVAVPIGGRLSVGELGPATGLLVAGGLTPAYAAALAPVAVDVRAWLASRGAPYCGYSAGSAVAASHAVVGGWQASGEPICPPEAGEDLDEVTVTAGLGIVPFTVEVHAAQWGTTPRLAEALRRLGPGHHGYAIDEDTALIVAPGSAPRVVGAGRAEELSA